MSDLWKKAFSRNRKAIIGELANPDEVADYLFSDGIFTVEMRDKVQQEPEPEKKTRLILDTLDRRGPRSVRCLYNAFQETANDRLADLLADYATVLEKKENFNDPKEWPPTAEEQQKMEEQEVFTIKDIKSPLLHEYKKNDVYKMHNQVRGKVFMINNTFSQSPILSYRKGSEHDVRNLSNLFQQLHFEVEKGSDLSAQGMWDFLVTQQNKNKEDWKSLECVVLILMSHGQGDCILGNDGKAVKLKDLTDIFSTEYCPDLDGKPRLVFVQACRGEHDPTKTEVIEVDIQKLKLTQQSSNMDVLDSDVVPECSLAKSEGKQFEVKHPSADFLVAYSTPDGTKSYRHTGVGSWFLIAIVWTFKYHAKREELHHLLIRVNRVVAKGQSEKDPRKFTVSEVKSNLRKKFYFFPGVHGDEPALFK